MAAQPSNSTPRDGSNNYFSGFGCFYFLDAYLFGTAFVAVGMENSDVAAVLGLS